MGKKRFGIGALILTFVLSFAAFGAAAYFLLTRWVSSPVGFVQLGRTLHLIQSYYVDESNSDDLYAGAIRGMVKELNDPYSEYLDSKDFEALSNMTEGHFGGVGLVMGMKDQQFIVVSPIEDTPAYRAGIKAGDIITRVDDTDLAGMTLTDVVKLLRGADGTTVRVTYKRGDDEKETTITRSEIKIRSVYGKMEDDHIGYIRITNFNADTAKDFESELKKLEDQGMQALVLDLRDNPGGLLESGVDVARHLVPKGPIVSLKDRNGHTEVETSDLEAVKYPLAVLVNHGTASASEIVSGAIQDTKAGRLFGTKTFGKGVVQNVFMLSPNTAVKLTIAKYYTPSGRSIHKVGIEPDEVVEAKDEQGKNQLEAAEAYLREQLKAGKE
ncbi:MAG: S41 family peptidase [Acidaminococcus sp.]|jgi:carboxyl-terminal processing protease|nr:S41 family peptidase [Acidaminococcus sp.]MCI2100174.1 S41 family peptidase [Acidaminococcus sp.]MCI2114493.1 S41 family peptidase [Acidaminococcus sp.]MCI2116503.1 S41 family peptidase [Acidaminococcus sp.]